MTIALIAFAVSSIALWGLLLAFGIWAYRKFHFRSIPWLGAFMVLALIMTVGGQLGNLYIRDHSPDEMNTLLHYFGNGITLGTLMALFSYWAMFTSNLAYLILAVLVFSDIVLLLSNAGIEVKDKFGQRFISIRQKSTVLGVSVLLLKIVSSASFIFLLNLG